jgi:hypothetical protein
MRFFEKRQPQKDERVITAEALSKKKLTKVHGRRVWGESPDGGHRIEHAFDWHRGMIVTVEEFNEHQAQRHLQKPAREPRDAGGLSGHSPCPVMEDERDRNRRSGSHAVV